MVSTVVFEWRRRYGGEKLAVDGAVGRVGMLLVVGVVVAVSCDRVGRA